MFCFVDYANCGVVMSSSRSVIEPYASSGYLIIDLLIVPSTDNKENIRL